MSYVLKDGKKYFREWGAIGPRCTTDITEAEVFATETEAMQHPAYSFATTSFEPEEIATEDNTPWCHQCGALRPKQCNCGPRAEND
jgi:hypothetical protein